MVGALMLGFVAGVIARMMMPGDVFRKMGGPKSWGISILLGLAGALVGWVIFTLGLGIGDDDIFDWGGLIGAIIGTVIVLAFANWFFRRQAAAAAVAAPPPEPATPSAPPATPPATPTTPEVDVPPVPPVTPEAPPGIPEQPPQP
jgi:uncharacterized membrane protein YeaQ/YmgE (transglycosylase-associated protein family)